MTSGSRPCSAKNRSSKAIHSCRRIPVGKMLIFMPDSFDATWSDGNMRGRTLSIAARPEGYNPRMPLTAEAVKAKARELGADGVGIASAAVLNTYPPDPAYPQIPARISPEVRSCVAFFKRIPAGAFRARDTACVHHVDQLVLREMDKVGYRIARFLEDEGYWAFQTAAQETVWAMKNASYGYLSTRHVAIEAGLGTLGLELNLLTKEVGPRCYTTVVLTDAVLEPDGKLTEQLCVGEPCSRCLYSCPPDAVQHWGLDKRLCATFAQEFG